MDESRPPTEVATTAIAVAPLAAGDLASAERVMRLAFGTFLGMPEPQAFLGDATHVRTRWLADPTAAFGAKLEGELVGSNFATQWGSVGFFGPLSVAPRYWDRGIGSRLLEPILERFDEWGTTHAGLFTFAQSPKHLALYQRFGFWPRFLTAIMAKPIAPSADEPAPLSPRWSRFAEVPPGEREATLAACHQVTDGIYDGLDVRIEVRTVAEHGLGDTVLLWDAVDAARLAGFAVCHCGAGSEAGSGVCFVKFGAVRSGPHVAEAFDHLLQACEALGAARGLSRLVAGVNTARHEAYCQMLAYGLRSDMQGVAMQRHNGIGYNRPGIYLIDDWR
jgi:GNAT superfamily N-acetyltransferase